MISGHLQVKKGYYYAVLSYCDDAGRRKSKWIATGLPEKNNKKKAESILIDERRNFIMPAPVVREDKGNPLFSYYMEKMWLPVIKGTVELSTYCSYEDHVVHIIVPYFKETGVHLNIPLGESQ